MMAAQALHEASRWMTELAASANGTTCSSVSSSVLPQYMQRPGEGAFWVSCLPMSISVSFTAMK